MRTPTIALAALALTSTTATAQLDGLSIGGGVGITASAHASGKAYHGAISLPAMYLHRGAELRVEGMYQRGEVSGSPFACERVRQFYCLGRVDANQIAAAAVFVRIPGRIRGWRLYADPIGAGLYHRRTKSAEYQGPTGICVRDGEVVSCPDNPDWATFAYRESRTSVGANVGVGFEREIAGLRVFAEARVHTLFERGESIAGSLPVTFGVTF